MICTAHDDVMVRKFIEDQEKDLSVFLVKFSRVRQQFQVEQVNDFRSKRKISSSPGREGGAVVAGIYSPVGFLTRNQSCTSETSANSPKPARILNCLYHPFILRVAWCIEVCA